MPRYLIVAVYTFAFSATVLVVAACRSPEGAPAWKAGSSDHRRVRGVICMFDRKPWISADAAADRDPEGLRYRVFLDGGKARGECRKGTFHVELYRIGRDENGRRTRTLASDWHYPTDTFPRVRAKILGEGYHVRLRWASKDLAGSEIELVTSFEDTRGRWTRSSTKRLRVPKYEYAVAPN